MITAARTIVRETRQDKGNAARTTEYWDDGGGKVNSDGDGESKGSAAMTAGYRSNGGGGDKDDSKGNIGKNRDCGGNNGGGVLYLSLIFFFLLNSGHSHTVRFFARYRTVM